MRCPAKRLQRLCSQLVLSAQCSAAEEDPEDAAFKRYCVEGTARALALGNRGPIRFDADGNLAKDILEKYWECGFYVLEGVIAPEEIAEFQREFEEIIENAPVSKGNPTDKHGRPVKRPKLYTFGRPLSDNIGGTKFGIYNWKDGTAYKDKYGYEGRHQVKMREPKPPPGAPTHVPSSIVNCTLNMDAALRVYGHPQLLRVVEAINGSDFTPFAENLVVKVPYYGVSTAWHQDVSSAWDTEGWGEPGFDLGTCGFNMHCSLYNCTPENALWMLPGSPKMGRVDQKALARDAGSDRFAGAVPILAKPGDVYIQNRLSLHVAFPNQSPEPRVSMQFGFHRRASVLGKPTGTYNRNGGEGKVKKVYDEEFIHKRSRMIQVAIDARKAKYPDETPYVYQPFVGKEDEARWDERLKEEGFKGYFYQGIVI